VAAGGADDDTAILPQGVPRIQHEIDQHLLNLRRVGPDLPDGWIQLELEPAGLAQQAGQDIGVGADKPVEVENAHLQRLAAAERKQLARQRGGLQAGLVDFLHFLEDLGLVRNLPGDDLAIPVDDRQEVVEIMRHAAGKPAHRIQALGMHEGFLQPALFGGVTVRGHHMDDPATGRGNHAEIP
jgi:hypothetical protein